MRGSMRQRSEGSWELRVFVMVAGPAPAGPAAGMTAGQMLEQWFAHAEGILSPSTADHTRPWV